MSSNLPLELKDAFHRAAVLERENSTLRNEIYRLEKVNKNLMDHSAQLSQQSRSDVRYQSLETDLAEARHKIVTLETENTNLVDEKLQLRQQLALLTADNEILSQDIITLSTMVNDLGGNPGLPASEAEPQTAVFQNGVTNTASSDPLISLDKQPSKEDALFFAPENRLKADIVDPHFCESNFNQLLSLVSYFKRELSDIYAQCPDPSKIKELLSNATKKDKSRASSPKVTESLMRKISELENKLCVAESRVMELEVLLADYEKQDASYVRMATEIEETRRTLAIAEEKLSGYENLQLECNDLRERFMTADRALTENLDAYKNLDNEYQATVQRLQAVSEIAERAKLLEEAICESETKNARLEQLLELAQAELSRYQTGEKRTLESAEAEIETLKASLAAKTSQLKEVTEQFESLMELKKKQDAKLNDVYDLRKRFDYMRERFDPMQKEIEKLRNKEKEYSRILSQFDTGTSKNDERLKDIESRYRQEIARKDGLISTLKEEKIKLNEEIIALRTSIHVRDEDGRRTRLNFLGASQAHTGHPHQESSRGATTVDKSGITMNDLTLQQPNPTSAPGMNSLTSSIGSLKQTNLKGANLTNSMVGVVPLMLRSSTIIGSRGYVGSAALSGIARAPSMNSQPE